MITTSTGMAGKISKVFVMRISISRLFKSSRIISGLLSLLTALLLGGCGMVRLGYSQLSEISYWWVDSYLDLNQAQGITLRQDLLALHHWHRTQELPALAQTLATLRSQASQDTTPERVCLVADELRTRLQAVLLQAEPGAVTLAASLSPEQLRYLQRQLEKRQKKWREDWLDGTPTERLDRRVEHLIDRSESFYGRLDPNQRAQLRTSVQASTFDPALAQTEMLRRQQDLMSTLQTISRAGASAPRMQDEIHQLAQRLLKSPNTIYQEQADQWTHAGCQTFAALHNSSSATQRQKLIAKLQDYEADALALMATPR
jgi:hypothetical protein